MSGSADRTGPHRLQRTRSWSSHAGVALGCNAKQSGPKDLVRDRRKSLRSFSHTDHGSISGLGPGEGTLSFFTPEELKRSVDEWRFPEVEANAVPGRGADEGEQLVGREIMVDTLGVGLVTDFHDLTDFNETEKHRNRKHAVWGSPHLIRFYESGMDAHGVERTVKLWKASEIKELNEHAKHGHDELQAHRHEFSPSHRAYMVKCDAVATLDTQADDQGLHFSDGSKTVDDEVDRVFNIVDKDGSGAISFQEFAGWLTRRQMATQGFVTPGNLKEWQVSWTKFDADGSHTLCRDEFKKVMEDIADKDWGEAIDPKTKRHYYYHKLTLETKWVKPSHDKEINDFLVRNGVKQQVEKNKDSGPMLTINVQNMIKTLRVQPDRYRGRRNFRFFLVYCFLLIAWWTIIADIGDGRGVETGLHSRISAIQFEVTPGPHFSQSIRATNWAGVRNLGDLYDLTLAMVENLYSDDDSTYFTPEDRVELKLKALQNVYRNLEFTQLWDAVKVDTDQGNVRQNCSNWVITDPSDGGFAGECEFFERCSGELLQHAQQIVALRGQHEADTFATRELKCREQRCAHRYNMVYDTCGVIESAQGLELSECSNTACKVKLRLNNLRGADCEEWMAVHHSAFTHDLISDCLSQTAATHEECGAIDTPAVSGVHLKLACEARAGCKYWTELWRESCVTTATYNSWKKHGASRQRPSTDANSGLTNLHNHPLPWLMLKMNRRKFHSCVVTDDADCIGVGKFTNEVDKTEFIGHETGAVYRYDKKIGGFPFYIRLDDTVPQTWIGLLELLRADHWLSSHTQDFTIECLTINRNTQTLGHWSITYGIDLAGMIKTERGLVVHSFPLDVVSPAQRESIVHHLAIWVFFSLMIDLFMQLRQVIFIISKEMGRGFIQLQIKAGTQFSVIPPTQQAVLASCHSVGCLLMLLLTGKFIRGELGDLDQGFLSTDWLVKSGTDPDRITQDLVGYRFTGVISDTDVEDATRCQPAGAIGAECEIGEKIQLVNSLSVGLESWVMYRSVWSLFCVYNLLRLLGKIYYQTNYAVLLVTIKIARRQLGSFLRLVLASGALLCYAFHLCYGRRFFAFRTMESTMFAIMGPILGGDSSLEAAVMESSRTGDNFLSVAIYWIYACYLIVLLYNVFIAIIVDGYEDAKDFDDNRRNIEAEVQEYHKVNELLDVIETYQVPVPESKKNVLYVKVLGAKVFSCGNQPFKFEEAQALRGYDFEVSIVQPWHGLSKVDPTDQHTTKATFTYLVKIERLRAPSNAPDGWPRGFTLQAVVRLRNQTKMLGKFCDNQLDSLWVQMAWARKVSRMIMAANQEFTNEEKWARDGLNFLEATLTDYINDKIDIHARNLIVDGTLDRDEGDKLEFHAQNRDLVATRSFIAECMRDLRGKAEAARSATLASRADPTLQKRLGQIDEEMRRLKVIERLAATELNHHDLVEALTKARDRMVDGEMFHRPSVRCPKPLVKKLWKAFATSEDEDLADTVGPPATWKQMERLDNKLTAMLNCEPAPDMESSALPTLVSKLNAIEDTLAKTLPQLENLTAQVESLSSEFTDLSSARTGVGVDVPPPPPPSSFPQLQDTSTLILPPAENMSQP